MYSRIIVGVDTETNIRIAYIGGGSLNWARTLMTDLALCDRLAGELALYDIDQAAAEANVELAGRIFGHPDARTAFRTFACATAEEALGGADFVVMSIEPGPLELRHAELNIPAKYGICQPVGDTTGPGGLLRGMRAVPVYRDYAHRIMDVCPEAWVINYTNPMTLCTAALYAAEPEIKAVGCCHEVYFTRERLARKVRDWSGVEAPARNEIRVDVAGVNHFTHATRATWQGEDLLERLREEIDDNGRFADRTAAARERQNNNDVMASDNVVADDFLRKFGSLGAAGDRHLVEFVPWYVRDGEAGLQRWGVNLTPLSWRLAKREERRRNGRTTPQHLKRSCEEGIDQMCALLGLGDLETNVNLPNCGQLAGLPDGAVVETLAAFAKDRVVPLDATPLPPELGTITAGIVAEQQLALQAALEGDRDLAIQSLLLDNLVELPTDKVAAMVDEMLEYIRPYFEDRRPMAAGETQRVMMSLPP